jgi:hypothetical protein
LNYGGEPTIEKSEMMELILEGDVLPNIEIDEAGKICNILMCTTFPKVYVFTFITNHNDLGNHRLKLLEVPRDYGMEPTCCTLL